MESSWSCLGSLEASWKPLGALLEASGAEKSNCETALGRPEATKETRFSKPGGQKAPETEPGSVQNRIPEATRAENGKITKLMGRFTKFFDF